MIKWACDEISHRIGLLGASFVNLFNHREAPFLAARRLEDCYPISKLHHVAVRWPTAEHVDTLPIFSTVTDWERRAS